MKHEQESRNPQNHLAPHLLTEQSEHRRAAMLRALQSAAASGAHRRALHRRALRGAGAALVVLLPALAWWIWFPRDGRVTGAGPVAGRISGPPCPPPDPAAVSVLPDQQPAQPRDPANPREKAQLDGREQGSGPAPLVELTLIDDRELLDLFAELGEPVALTLQAGRPVILHLEPPASILD